MNTPALHRRPQTSRSAFTLALLAMAVFTLAACGGGGAGDPAAPPPPPNARGFNQGIVALAAASDGSGDLYAVGEFTAYGSDPARGMARLNHDGSLDAAFDIGSGMDAPVWAIAPAIDGSGDVYAGGEFTTVRGQPSKALVRLNADGSIDTGFQVGEGFRGVVTAMALADDGDVYVGGYFSHYRGEPVQPVVRLNADGTLDRGFSLGSGWSLASGQAPVVDAIAGPDRNGHIIVAGDFDTFRAAPAPGIVRVRADGARDTSFNAGSGFGSGGPVWTLALAADGSGDIYAGGSFSTYRQASTKGLVRINADGSRDTGFEVGSGFAANEGGMAVWALLPRVDGSVDVGGYFHSYRGAEVGHFVHIRHDGARLDADFVRRPFNDSVSSLVRMPGRQNTFYVGGYFTRYDGTDTRRLVRLVGDGSVDNAFVATR